MSNPDVYPITAAFEQEFEGRLPKYFRTPSGLTSVQRLYEIIRETIGEYEHGTADVEDVFDDLIDDIRHTTDPDEFHRATMKCYAAVASDLLMTILNTIGDDRPSG